MVPMVLLSVQTQKKLRRRYFWQNCNKLKTQLQSICDTAAMRTCFSCVSRTPESYMGYLKNSRQEGLIEIVTDLPQVYEQIEQQQFSDPVFAQIPVRLYEDPLLPLAALYNLNKQTEEALQPKVWMKSGGYLVIEPTEALTVVDVNTGKSVNKKNRQEHFLKINLEAAEETAAQLRLRNISGIVIIDFINLEQEEEPEYRHGASAPLCKSRFCSGSGDRYDKTEPCGAHKKKS